MGAPPQIKANIKLLPGGSRRTVTWNVDFQQLSFAAGDKLNFHNGTPLTASAISNRLILSAATMDSDLYLGSPSSLLVGDKLYESGEKIDKSRGIIESLQSTVEFPDVRSLVNEGKIGIAEVLYLRKKAKKFRAWLQEESDRDRDAIIAYHNEVAKESGFTNVSRKALKLFGVIGGGAVGAAVGGPAGAAVGSATGYVLEIASKLGTDWKPVVFGNWYRDRIKKVLKNGG